VFNHSIEGDLLGDLEAVTKRLTADQRTLARDVARTARKALIADVRAKRGTLSFSGMGTKLGARTRVVAGALTATVYLDAVPAGAWAIVEHGRATSRPVKAEALHIGDGFAEEARATHGTGGLWFGAESSIEVAVLPVLEDWAGEAIDG
jgi:hypothetical protein